MSLWMKMGSGQAATNRQRNHAYWLSYDTNYLLDLEKKRPKTVTNKLGEFSGSVVTNERVIDSVSKQINKKITRPVQVSASSRARSYRRRKPRRR